MASFPRRVAKKSHDHKSTNTLTCVAVNLIFGYFYSWRLQMQVGLRLRLRLIHPRFCKFHNRCLLFWGSKPYPKSSAICMWMVRVHPKSFLNFKQSEHLINLNETTMANSYVEYPRKACFFHLIWRVNIPELGLTWTSCVLVMVWSTSIISFRNSTT